MWGCVGLSVPTTHSLLLNSLARVLLWTCCRGRTQPSLCMNFPLILTVLLTHSAAVEQNRAPQANSFSQVTFSPSLTKGSSLCTVTSQTSPPPTISPWQCVFTVFADQRQAHSTMYMDGPKRVNLGNLNCRIILQPTCLVLHDRPARRPHHNENVSPSTFIEM